MAGDASRRKAPRVESNLELWKRTLEGLQLIAAQPGVKGKQARTQMARLEAALAAAPVLHGKRQGP
jgi:hypothetical protein